MVLPAPLYIVSFAMQILTISSDPMTQKFPMPFELRSAVCSFLRKAGKTIEFQDSACLVNGSLGVEVVERAWSCGDVILNDSGELFVCGLKVPFHVDPARIKRKVTQHLHSNVSVTDLVAVAGAIGVSIK